MLYSVLLMGAILMGVGTGIAIGVLMENRGISGPDGKPWHIGSYCPLGYPYLHSSRFYNVLLFDYSIRSLIVG